MAKTKKDLERDNEKYSVTVDAAREALDAGRVRDGVRLALSAWDYIDGMMQYGRRYENTEFDSIEAIEIVLRYAPLLFDHVTLASLRHKLAAEKRIERDTAADMGERLARATSLMWEARRLWDHIATHRDIREDTLRESLGGDQSLWRSITETWEKIGLLNRANVAGSYLLSIATRLGQVVPAKCSSCGRVATGPKAIWLEPTDCPSCHTLCMFVMSRGQYTPTES